MGAGTLSAPPHCPRTVQLFLLRCCGPMSLLERGEVPLCNPLIPAVVDQLVPDRVSTECQTTFEPEGDVSCISVINLFGRCTGLPLAKLLLCFLSGMPSLKCSEQLLPCPSPPTFFHKTNKQPACRGGKQDRLVDSVTSEWGQ